MIKTIFKIIGLLLFAFIAFLLWTAESVGFFRKIENPYKGKIIQTIKVKGSEDFAISRKDSFMIVSSFDFGKLLDPDKPQGQLGYIDLTKQPYELVKMDIPSNLKIYPHGISMIEIDSAKYQLYVINHITPTNNTIEVFNLKNEKLEYLKTISDPLIHDPNDLIVLAPDEFYVTNDHGSTTESERFWEDHLGLKKSGVTYYKNGQTKDVADNIAYANGINYDANRKLLYVASPRGFKILVYERLSNGELKYAADIDCNTGIDNLELDEQGNIWTGAHPKLLAFSAYAEAPDGTKIAPSEVMKITYNSKEDHTVETLYMDDGVIISGSSVALPFNGHIFVGAVKHDQMIVLEQ